VFVIIGVNILLEFSHWNEEESRVRKLALMYCFMACLLKSTAKVEMNLLMGVVMVIFELGLILIIGVQDRIVKLYVL
jgi:hypothetical protein